MEQTKKKKNKGFACAGLACAGLGWVGIEVGDDKEYLRRLAISGEVKKLGRGGDGMMG